MSIKNDPAGYAMSKIYARCKEKEADHTNWSKWIWRAIYDYHPDADG